MWRAARLALALGVHLALAGPAVPAAPTDRPPPAAPAASPFADWAAVVVAGDRRSYSGAPTEAFDNARRDVRRALIGAGFQPQHLNQFSVRPGREQPRPQRSDVDAIHEAMSRLAGQARGGCLAYFTSHGDPEGVVVADELLAPSVLDAILDDTCGRRPTIVVISACYSGVFVPELAGPNRMVLTAARGDRSSFGCGEADRYPYFDACFLSAFSQARDFARLAASVQTCVARREIETGMSPPSEPQLSIGAELWPMLPRYALPAAQPASARF